MNMEKKDVSPKKMVKQGVPAAEPIIKRGVPTEGKGLTKRGVPPTSGLYKTGDAGDRV